MQRVLFIAGLVLLALALLWPWLAGSNWWRWIGRLPGDLRVEREGSFFYFPLTTSIIVSLLITLLVWLFRR